MCADPDILSLEVMRARTSRIKAWKILTFPEGSPLVVSFPEGLSYKPGWNYAYNEYKELLAPDYKYSIFTNSGIHAYISGKHQVVSLEGIPEHNIKTRFINVEIEPKDVLACESKYYTGTIQDKSVMLRTFRQIVARKIWINPKEWASHGFSEETPAQITKEN